MSSDVISSETPPVAKVRRARWRFATPEHWAKATFGEGVTPASIALIEPAAKAPSIVQPRDVVIHVSPRPRRTVRKAARNLLWCAISAAFHLVVIIVFGVTWTAAQPPGDHVFITVENAARQPERLDQLAIEPLPAMKIASDIAVPTSFAGAGTPDAIVIQTPVLGTKPTGRRARARGPSDDARALAGLGGAGPSGEAPSAAESPGADATTATGANFFGVQASGSQFVFVVDCSLSMQGSKWTTACAELSESINRLSPQQSFYVVFFDGEMHRMFDEKHHQKSMLPATEDNLRKLAHWLGTVRLGYNTSPCLSVKFAASLHPDAIFLLSDGEFSDPTAAFLRKNNFIVTPDGKRKADVAVHTIGFKSKDGQKMLSRIARENGGEYRFVP